MKNNRPKYILTAFVNDERCSYCFYTKKELCFVLSNFLNCHTYFEIYNLRGIDEVKYVE